MHSSREHLLPTSKVRERYSVSDMTLYRWLRDESLGFPQPIYLNKRRYWEKSRLEAWEKAKRDAAA